jgi:hypothetical protein
MGRNKPYCVQPILQSTLSGFATDKLLNNFQLVFTAGFKSAGVVENITGVVDKNEFIVNVMQTTLKEASS